MSYINYRIGCPVSFTKDMTDLPRVVLSKNSYTIGYDICILSQSFPKIINCFDDKKIFPSMIVLEIPNYAASCRPLWNVVAWICYDD